MCIMWNMIFQVRDPMPAVFFFLVDVSMNAIQTGATAAACSAINQVITDLPVSSCLDSSCKQHVIREISIRLMVSDFSSEPTRLW